MTGTSDESTTSASTASASTTNAATSDAPSTSAPSTNGQQPVQNALTLIMKIKSDADYQQLNTLLQQNWKPYEPGNVVGAALNDLALVHFARFVFLENNTKLALITSYDGNFSDYVNDFVDKIAFFFNALLQHMEGAPPLPVEQNRQQFIQYAQDNNAPIIEPFYSAYPKLTVLDIQANAQSNS